MKENKYQVYLGVINYTIILDEKNKIKKLKVGNSEIYFRNCGFPSALEISSNLQVLKTAFRFMFISEPETFKQLYILLKNNDLEMFMYVKEVLNELGTFCLELSTQ